MTPSPATALPLSGPPLPRDQGHKLDTYVVPRSISVRAVGTHVAHLQKGVDTRRSTGPDRSRRAADPRRGAGDPQAPSSAYRGLIVPSMSSMRWSKCAKADFIALT